MPIYEYQCRTCGRRFSHLHRRLDESVPPCPECGRDGARKLLSVFHAGAAAPRAPSCSLGTCPTSGSCRTGTCPLG